MNFHIVVALRKSLKSAKILVLHRKMTYLSKSARKFGISRPLSPPNFALAHSVIWGKRKPVGFNRTTKIPTKDINMDGKGVIKFVGSLYYDPFRWQVVKGVSFFAVGVWVAREMAFAELHPEQAV